MKTIAALSALVFSVCAWPDGQAPITFSGKGNNPIEVRDAAGNITEVVSPSKLRLNQIPADAVAREEAARAKRQEVAVDVIAKQTEEKATADAGAATAKAEDAEKALEAATAAQEEEAKVDHYPRKVRRNTVRGTLYEANPPPPKPPAPQPEGPVLSMSGRKPVEPAPEEAPATVAGKQAAPPAESTDTP